MSPRKIRLGGFSFSVPDLPPWAERYGKYAAYPAFGLFTFLLVLYLSLPFGKIKDRIELEVAAAGYDAEIHSLGPAFLLGIKAKDVVIRTRPRAPGEKAMAIALDRIVAKVGLFGLLVRRPSVDFSIEGLGGEASGSFEQGREVEAELKLREINLAQIPGLEAATKLPLAGTVNGKADLVLPKGKFADAHGQIELALSGIAVGNGKAKLTVPGDPFLSQGLTVPRIELGAPSGKITIEKGTARVVSLEGHSADMDIRLEGDVVLRDPPAFSMANLCLLFRPTEALTKRATLFELVGPSLGQAKRGDGFYGIRLTGRIDAMRGMPARCGAGQTGVAPSSGGVKAGGPAPGTRFNIRPAVPTPAGPPAEGMPEVRNPPQIAPAMPPPAPPPPPLPQPAPVQEESKPDEE